MKRFPLTFLRIVVKNSNPPILCCAKCPVNPMLCPCCTNPMFCQIICCTQFFTQFFTQCCTHPMLRPSYVVPNFFAQFEPTQCCAKSTQTFVCSGRRASAHVSEKQPGRVTTNNSLIFHISFVFCFMMILIILILISIFTIKLPKFVCHMIWIICRCLSTFWWQHSGWSANCPHSRWTEEATHLFPGKP